MLAENQKEAVELQYLSKNGNDVFSKFQTCIKSCEVHLFGCIDEVSKIMGIEVSVDTFNLEESENSKELYFNFDGVRFFELQ